MSNQDIDPFWMIYGVGQGASTVIHKTFDSAKTEAQRLARANPGIEFFVLASVARARRVDVEFEMVPGFSALDGIPF